MRESRPQIIIRNAVGKVIATFFADNQTDYTLQLRNDGLVQVSDEQRPRIVTFLYNKGRKYSWETDDVSWRTIRVSEDSENYLKGYEGEDFKCFSKSKIVDGRIIEGS